MNCPLSWLAGRKIAALSALGNPAAFEAMLEMLGAHLVARFRFRDHKKISDDELASVCQEAQDAGAEAVFTTEKDAVKLNLDAVTLPLLTLQVEMRIAGESSLWNVIESVLNSHQG